MLEGPGEGGKRPARLAVLPAPGQQAWTARVWEGNPGDTVTLVVKNEMRAWQKMGAVAAGVTAAGRATVLSVTVAMLNPYAGKGGGGEPREAREGPRALRAGRTNSRRAKARRPQSR